MSRYLRCGSFVPLLSEALDLTGERALVHVAADAVVQLEDRRHGALSEAGHRADREFAVRGAEGELIGVGLADHLGQPEIEQQRLQKAAGPARVAGGPPADANRM